MTISSLGGSADQLQDHAADVCIVGAGIAGLLAARHLTRRGRSVVVLESGGEDVTEWGQSLNGTESALAELTSANAGRFRGLGGSAQRWGGRFLPLTAAEVAARPHLGVAAWPVDLADLETHRAELEDVFGLPSGSYEEDAVAGLASPGLLPVGDPDFAIRVPKWAPYSRVNLGAGLKGELSRSLTTHVVLDATVTSMQVDAAGRLSNVIASSQAGAKVNVRAREFVLAAGAIENARLLLVCDRDHENRVFAGCDALGRFLQEHLGTKVADLELNNIRLANRTFGYHFEQSARRNFHLDLRATAQGEDRTAAAFAHITLSPRADSATEAVKRIVRSRQTGSKISRSDLRAMARSPAEIGRGVWWRLRHHQHFWPDDLDHQVNVWIEQLPDAENRVELSPTSDSLGVPKARISWRVGPQDGHTLAAATRRLAAYWNRHNLNALGSLEWTADARQSLSNVDDTTAHQLVPLNHPSGTTRMGSDPRTSVVDREMRCHRLRNVSIAGSSVFPSAGATGPTYTVGLMAIAVAERLARSTA